MDATISVICFKSKTLANGEHPLLLRITKDRRRTMKSLGVSVHPSNWDFERNEPKPKCPDRKYIQQIILKVKSEYQTKLLEKQPAILFHYKDAWIRVIHFHSDTPPERLKSACFTANFAL